ncbi:MAG: hypothetical protein MJ120_07260 [Clostridia bacterium]|nr:hypothetical protein [Clostridia bacterium]
MKKSIKIISLISAVLILFSGCGKPKKPTDQKDADKTTSATSQAVTSDDKTTSATTEKTKKTNLKIKNKALPTGMKELFTQKGKRIIALVGADMSYGAILEDISNIDFALKADYDKNKYTVKTTKDEDGIECNQYFKGNTLVYEKFVGVGENGFSHFTKTKSGADAKVSYYLADGKIDSVVVKTDKYRVAFSNKSGDKFNNAEMIAEKNNSPKLNERLMYEISEGNVTLSEANYYGDGGYCKYFSWLNNENKLEESEEVEYKAFTGNVNYEPVKQIKALEIYNLQTLIRSQNLSFKDDKWYMTTDLYVLFGSQQDAEKYAEKNGISKDKVSNDFVQDDTTWYVKYTDVTLPVSKSFKLNGNSTFEIFATQEFDDATFATIAIDDNNEITAIDYNNSTLSYY